MAILVTGGCGYIGSHTVKALLAAGEQVIVLDNLCQGHPESIGDARLVVGNYGAPHVVGKIFSTNEIEAVIHFGAFACVPDSVVNPSRYYDNNVVKTLNLLNTMHRFGCNKIIFSSSAAVYGDHGDKIITESDPTVPINPYGWSKLLIEQILADYDIAYDLKSISFRYFCAAGASLDGSIGEQHSPEHHLIPNIMHTLVGDQHLLKIYGSSWPTHDGTCVRDFVHVCDIANAHIAGLNALRDGHNSDVYNIGSGTGYSVHDVINVIENVTQRVVAYTYEEARPGDPAMLVASNTKLREIYTVKHDLECIIRTAWMWHARNH